MKLEELDYQFENAGQYRAIMKSLGYREEYSNGYIKFSSDEGTIQRSINDIKAAAKELNITEDSYNTSLAYITSFFDKEKAKADFNSYNKYLEDNYNISITKWDNLKEHQRLNENQSIDGFTIIDHKNKISYTGSRLYKYGYENGFVLDGKGTQVNNDLTELLDLTGGRGKIKKNKAGNLTIESNHILIPYLLFGKYLEDWQKTGLEHGEIVLIRNSKNKPIYLQVDQKNNIITVRTDREIKLPKSVGGHEFSDLEKTLILNNKFTPPILIKDNNKYWLAETRISEDKKGFEFKNMIEVSKDKAKEIQEMDIRNSKEIFVYTNGRNIEPAKQKELEIAILKGLQEHSHNGALLVLLDNAKNGISTNMPNLYDKYGLTDLKNDLEDKRSIIFRNETPEATKEFNDALEKFKDKLKDNLLELEPGIYPDKRELAQDIISLNEEFEKIEKIEKALDQKFNISEVNVTNEIELKNDITPEEKQTIQPKDESVYLTVQEQKVIAAIVANDYVELNKIALSNFTPSEALKKEIEGLNLSQDKKVGVMAILGYDSLDKPKTAIEKDKEKKGPTKTNAKDQTLKAIDGLFR